jgi:hypothetical protein
MKTNENVENVRLAMQIYLMVNGDKNKLSEVMEIIKTM